MTPLHYSKLVRDNIPDILSRRGGKITYHVAGSDEEFWRKLKEKLQEELDEFAQRETIKNMADVLEVIYAMCELKKFDRKELEAVRENKAIEMGTFSRRIILDTSSEQEGIDQGQLI